MNKGNIATLVLAAMILSSCGSTDSNQTEMSTVWEPIEEVEESVTTKQSVAETAIGVGTYIGEYGDYLTLFSDGTADYFFHDDDDVSHENTWSCAEGSIIVSIDELDGKILADIPDDGDVYDFSGFTEYWDTEAFKLVTTDTASYSAEEYRQLRKEAITVQEKKQIDGFDSTTNTICTMHNLNFPIPAYWGEPSPNDEGSMTFYYINKGNVDSLCILAVGLITDDANCGSMDDLDWTIMTNGVMSSVEDLWISESKIADDVTATACGIGVVHDGSKTYNLDFHTWFILDKDTDEIYVVILNQAIGLEDGYVDDVGRIVNAVTSSSSSQNDEAVISPTEETQRTASSGVYAYVMRGQEYHHYYILDLDEGYVYDFLYGDGSQDAIRGTITSGDLNNGLVVTYQDGGDIWNNYLHWKYIDHDDHLILNDGTSDFDFWDTGVDHALEIMNRMTISVH